MFLLKVLYLGVVISVTVGQYLNIHFSDDDRILEEGDECLIENIGQGKCILASKCLDRNNLRPKVCSFSGIEAVICCRNSERISEKKCDEYSKYVPAEIILPPGVHGILKGETTKPSEFPHMSAIGWTLENNNVEWKCGGSLISEDFVITAAHCSTDGNSSPDVVRIGDQNVYKVNDGALPEEIKILSILKHPLYESISAYNDIALIKLASKANLNWNLRPACLYTKEEIYTNEIIATGWGRLAYGGNKSAELQKVNLKVISNDICSGYFPINRKLSNGIVDSQFCLGDDDGRDTCQGDSGGPVQIRTMHNNGFVYHIVGVTSFGVLCGTSAPGVYTRLSSFIDWVERVVWL